MRFQSGITDQVIYFVAVDSTDLKTRETGLTTFTVYRSRDGSAATAYTTPTVTEVDSTNMPGVYKLLLDEDMTIASGNDSEAVVLHITQASMAPVTIMFELYRPIVTAGNTLDVTATGAAGVDWGNVENKTTTNALTNTSIITTQQVDVNTIKTNPVVNGGTVTFPTNATLASTTNITAGTITTVTTTTTATNLTNLPSIPANWLTAAGINTGAITAAKFAAGAIDAAAIADGAIDAATFAAGAITASAIAADAIGASELAADAATEIGTAVWATAARTLTAGTNIALAKGTGVTGFNDLDAAGVRSAVGLASANLDTQLDALPTAAENATAVLTTAMTEAYSTDGGTVTVAQALYELLASAQEAAISGTTMTVKKRDGTTTAYVLTLDDATAPTTKTRSA